MTTKKLFGIVCMSGLLYLVINLSLTKSDLAGNFGANDIRQIQFGDSLERVIDILGLPYQLKTLNGHHMLGCENPKDMVRVPVDSTTNFRQIINETFADTNYCCSGNEQDLSHKWCTLVYSRPVQFSRYYPMLWVHLDSNFQVSQVFAKRYEGHIGLDDPAIYSLDSKGVWENEIVFNDCFKK